MYPNGMATANREISSFPMDGNTHENKEHCKDAASDRESSIESYHTNKSEFSNPTDNELIDVDEIELSDEESWLYKSPKKLSSADKEINTRKWLHRDVENIDLIDEDTKTALVSKLNELKILNSNAEKQEAEALETSLNSPKCDEYKKPVASSLECPVPGGNGPVLTIDLIEEQKLTESRNDQNHCLGETKDQGNSLINDVIDVRKIARLQEESLKQSTFKFLNLSEKKPFHVGHLSPDGRVEGGRLCKLLSTEALNMCNGKNRSNIFTPISSYGIKTPTTFGSTASLSHSQDVHRGSLPNINKGYFTLKPKKSKYPADQKMQCPLPIYPANSKSKVNGTASEASFYESQSPLCDYRESRTLPSSYRVHSRNNSPRNFSTYNSLPRRESTPVLLCQKYSVSDLNRRDSAPCSSRKPSTLSPSAQYQRYSLSPSSLQPSPTKTSQHLLQSCRSPPNNHRRPSHSPSRRLPLSTVHNQSKKLGDNSALHTNGEFRALKLPSKLTSPVSRSGIPVPSTQCMSRPHSEDESWNQDCF